MVVKSTANCSLACEQIFFECAPSQFPYKVFRKLSGISWPKYSHLHVLLIFFYWVFFLFKIYFYFLIWLSWNLSVNDLLKQRWSEFQNRLKKHAAVYSFWPLTDNHLNSNALQKRHNVLNRGPFSLFVEIPIDMIFWGQSPLICCFAPNEMWKVNCISPTM